MHVTTYGVPATGVTKKVMKGVSDLYEVIDIIQLPSDLVNVIDKPVHPLDALQYHIVKMNNDLVHETSNLWALSNGTLKYLQYTWGAVEDSIPAELSGELTIAGSTTALPINQECARLLMVENPKLRISVSGGGSGHGVKAVGEGAIDIGAASRDVKSKEMEMYPDLKPVVIGKDSVAIVLHPNNDVSELTMEGASKIFSGEIKNWKDVGGADAEIRVITREGGSGTRDCFETSVMKPFDREILGKALVKPSNGDIRATVSRDENCIGYLSLGYVDASLKAVKIDGVEATVENVLSDDYLISRSLYLITKGEPSELEKAFIDFVLSKEGQKVVEDMGYIRVTGEVTPTSPPENLQVGDIIVTTVYHHVRNITDWNNPLDPDNRIFTMHPPDESVNPPYDVGKIIDHS
jgi:phosphate transport system substrate-binding protein